MKTKSAVQHTPGPWNQEGGRSIYSEKWGMDRIALSEQASPRMPMTEVEANATLIASAPELLEALKLCADFIDQNMKPHAALNTVMLKADNAIAKAEGK